MTMGARGTEDEEGVRFNSSSCSALASKFKPSGAIHLLHVCLYKGVYLHTGTVIWKRVGMSEDDEPDVAEALPFPVILVGISPQELEHLCQDVSVSFTGDEAKML